MLAFILILEQWVITVKNTVIHEINVRLYVSVEDIDLKERQHKISNNHVRICASIGPMSNDSLQWIHIWNYMLASVNKLIVIYMGEKNQDFQQLCYKLCYLLDQWVITYYKEVISETKW